MVPFIDVCIHHHWINMSRKKNNPDISSFWRFSKHYTVFAICLVKCTAMLAQLRPQTAHVNYLPVYRMLQFIITHLHDSRWRMDIINPETLWTPFHSMIWIIWIICVINTNSVISSFPQLKTSKSHVPLIRTGKYVPKLVVYSFVYNSSILFNISDVTMSTIASQITSLTIVYSTVYSGPDQTKYQSSASLAFVWGIQRGPVNSPHKWPVTRKMFTFDNVIMTCCICVVNRCLWIFVYHFYVV